MNDKIPIENIVDVMDDTILWYDIPLFHGYQISNNNFMIRKIDGSKYGSCIEQKTTRQQSYRGNRYVILHLEDGRITNARINDLWDLVVRAQPKSKSTKEAIYDCNYDISIFPDCNAITGLPECFKLIGKVKRKGGNLNGIV